MDCETFNCLHWSKGDYPGPLQISTMELFAKIAGIILSRGLFSPTEALLQKRLMEVNEKMKTASPFQEIKKRQCVQLFLDRVHTLVLCTHFLCARSSASNNLINQICTGLKWYPGLWIFVIIFCQCVTGVQFFGKNLKVPFSLRRKMSSMNQ